MIIKDQQHQESDIEKPKKSLTRYNMEANIDKADRGVLHNVDYPRPNDFFDTSTEKLREIHDEVKNVIKGISYKISGFKRNKQITKEDKENYIRSFQWQKDTLNKYKNILKLYLKSFEYKGGEGIFYFNNPHQLLDRLELLGGSILAGNNGVIPEFSQIAHLLNQMKVISKKQLNDLLKSYIPIR